MPDCYEPNTPECVIVYRDGAFVVDHHHAGQEALTDG